MKWLRWIDDRSQPGVIMGVRGYQLALSPWLGQSCRFSPSCSQYGIDAVEHHGTLSGVWLTVKRLLRCHLGAKGVMITCRSPPPVSTAATVTEVPLDIPRLALIAASIFLLGLMLLGEWTRFSAEQQTAGVKCCPDGR